MTARLRHRLWVCIPLALLALLYAYLATRVGVGYADGGPDEGVRMLVPKAIVAGHWLPSGYDPLTIRPWGNYSYAFYPQLLGPYVTALCMGVARLVGAGAAAQLFAARLSSVLWGVVGAFFVGKSVRVCIDDEHERDVYGALGTVLVGFWPQYAFVSAYVNNDVVGLAGVAILVCALVTGIRGGWHRRSCALLAAGIVVCALGYLNTYGFILAAIVTFIASCVAQHADRKQDALRPILLTALACAVCTFPFFAVNIVRYGDVIGSRVFEEQHLAWVAQGNEPLMRPYEESFWSLVLLDPFVSTTLRSFVGQFGYMYVPAPDVVRCFYWGTLLMGSGAFLGSRLLRRRCWSARWWVCVVALLGAAAITVALHVWRTLTTDYQAQGRYIIIVLIPWVVMATLGMRRIFGGGRMPAVTFATLYAAICVATLVYAAWHWSWAGIFADTAEMHEFLATVIP